MERHYFRKLLTSLLLLTPTIVSAYDFEVDGIYYGVDGETVYVTYKDKRNGSYSGDIVIPENVEHDGKSFAVTAIGENAFSESRTMTSVSLPSSLKSIGTFAFYNCQGLYEIEIPNSVERIEESAFYKCTWLEYFILPASVTSVGPMMLFGCTALEYIEVDPENPVYDSREDCFAIIETATNTMVQGCTYSFIPTSVTSIGEAAMASTQMRFFEIPNSVKTIGNYAFRECSELEEIILPNSVTSIGDVAFSMCEKLEEVTLPASLTKIGDMAFTNSDALERIYCEATTPPSWASYTVFSSYRIDRMILYVPTDCRPVYQAAKGWNQFTNIREYTPDGIDGLKPDTSAPAEIFTLSGKKVSEAKKGGIYIFRHADGKAYKRMVK